jgi:hypothetical protein
VALNSAGVATYAGTAPASAGPLTISATYKGSAEFSSSTSSTLNETVVATGTTSALGISPSGGSLTAGAAYTLTATVTAASGTVTPTGNVTFNIGTGTQTVALNSAGVAIYAGTAPASAGPLTISATYKGSAEFSPSTSNSLNETVVAIGTMSALGISPSGGSLAAGEPYTLTASVSPTSGTATCTGNVLFTIGSTTQTVALNASGVATYTITAPAAGGSLTISAAYQGSAEFSPSTSNTMNETVLTISPILPYIEVNGGAWQYVASVTVAYGSTVNLGPQPGSGGTWSWTGPNGFTSTSRQINSIPLTSASNTFTATYTNSVGLPSTQVFTITIAPTPIVPYIQDFQLNGGAWQNVSSLTANYGDTVNFGPQPGSGGTWSWTGPNGFTSTSRAINRIPLTSPINVFTATYTNQAGVTSTQAFTITVASTPIVPYLEVNGGALQNASSITASYTDTVNLGPQPGSGGSWSWTGPNGFMSTSRAINGIPLTSPINVFTATYSNQAGVTSTQAFTITIAPTPIAPYLDVNGGAWLATNSVSVASGSTVNLGPQPGSGGSWSWTGPNGFTSTVREIDGITPSAGTNNYVATYTNPDGVTSMETFTIIVN